MGYWTSGNQLIKGDCRGPYVWKVSKDKLLAFDFTSWTEGEPNCGDTLETCVGIDAFHKLLWHDAHCDAKLCALCEYTPDEFDNMYVSL